jgi:hypothetical protein
VRVYADTGFLARLVTDEPRRRLYPAFAMATGFEAGEIPSGKRASQQLSVSSTWSIKLALAGAWLTGDSNIRKSGPICETAIGAPSTSRRMVTLAECPP